MLLLTIVIVTFKMEIGIVRKAHWVFWHGRQTVLKVLLMTVWHKDNKIKECSNYHKCIFFLLQVLHPHIRIDCAFNYYISQALMLLRGYFPCLEIKVLYWTCRLCFASPKDCFSSTFIAYCHLNAQILIFFYRIE